MQTTAKKLAIGSPKPTIFSAWSAVFVFVLALVLSACDSRQALDLTVHFDEAPLQGDEVDATVRVWVLPSEWITESAEADWTYEPAFGAKTLADEESVAQYTPSSEPELLGHDLRGAVDEAGAGFREIALDQNALDAAEVTTSFELRPRAYHVVSVVHLEAEDEKSSASEVHFGVTYGDAEEIWDGDLPESDDLAAPIAVEGGTAAASVEVSLVEQDTAEKDPNGDPNGFADEIYVADAALGTLWEETDGNDVDVRNSFYVSVTPEPKEAALGEEWEITIEPADGDPEVISLVSDATDEPFWALLSAFEPEDDTHYDIHVRNTSASDDTFALEAETEVSRETLAFLDPVPGGEVEPVGEEASEWTIDWDGVAEAGSYRVTVIWDTDDQSTFFVDEGLEKAITIPAPPDTDSIDTMELEAFSSSLRPEVDLGEKGYVSQDDVLRPFAVTEGEPVDRSRQIVTEPGPDRIDWTFEMPADRNTVGGAIASDGEGHVYVIDSSARIVYALKEASGEIAWEFDVREEFKDDALIANGIVVGDHGLYFPTYPVDLREDGALLALDFSGDLQWDFGDVESGVAADGDTVYAPGADGELYALDGDKGDELWSFDANDPIDGGTFGRDNAPSVGTDGMVYAGTRIDNEYGRLYALDPEAEPSQHGEEVWSFTTDPHQNTRHEIRRRPTIASNPSDEETIYLGADASVANDETPVFSLAADAEPEGPEHEGVNWEFLPSEGDIRMRASTVAPDGTVIVSGWYDLFALDPTSGDELWRGEYEGTGTVQAGAAIGDAGLVYVAAHEDDEAVVDALEVETGERVWRLVLPGEDVEVEEDVLLDHAGYLYVGTENGRVHRIATESTGPAASAWPMAGGNPRRTGLSDDVSDE